jgi:UDP-4-amino-4-deoxy-L-arabinose formyltransferase/UDP-glucuronic acid dehydrogenase (UDP-4-keto-hexauronic acid decarboxylating)
MDFRISESANRFMRYANNTMTAIEITKPLPLRTIFWGYHDSGWTSYSELRNSPAFRVVGIVLPTNRDHETLEKFEEDGRKFQIPVLRPKNPSAEEFLSQLKSLRADFHFVDSYTRLIPKAAIDIAGMGFNVHPGLLPKYRGAHVLNWVLINGENETGISLHQLTEKFDEGPVVSCAKIEISLTDTAADLDRKLIEKIPELIRDFERQVQSGKITLQEQSGPAAYYSARTPDDGLIAAADSAMSAHNKIRAISYPWPGAFLKINDTKIVIWESMPLEEESNFPVATIVTRGEKVFYVAGDHRLVELLCVNRIGQEEYQPVRGAEILATLEECGVSVAVFQETPANLER